MKVAVEAEIVVTVTVAVEAEIIVTVEVAVGDEIVAPSGEMLPEAEAPAIVAAGVAAEKETITNVALLATLSLIKERGKEKRRL